MPEKLKILIYAYGNPGRQDDGLGKALIELAEECVCAENLTHVTLDVNYQLQVEDITEIHGKDMVIFVDASLDESVVDYLITPVYADPQTTFSMHAVAPGYLLALYNSMYGNHPPTFLLHIRGYKWELNKAICPEARKNLNKAWCALKAIIQKPDCLFEEIDPLQTKEIQL